MSVILASLVLLIDQLFTGHIRTAHNGTHKINIIVTNHTVHRLCGFYQPTISFKSVQMKFLFKETKRRV